jgi:hypothetical protein
MECCRPEHVSDNRIVIRVEEIFVSKQMKPIAEMLHSLEYNGKQIAGRG